MLRQVPRAVALAVFLSCLTCSVSPRTARAQDQPYTAPVVLQVIAPGVDEPITVTVQLAVTLPPGVEPASLPLTVTQATVSAGRVRVLAARPAQPVEGGRAVALTPGATAIVGLPAATPQPAATAEPEPLAGAVNDAANLRTGPGTSYAVAGKAQAGDAVQVVGRSADGEWWKLAGGEWIAAFLVDVEGEAGLPVAEAPSAAEGWPRYEMISGEFSFAYPPSLSVDSEDVNDVVLDEGGLYGASLIVSLPDTAGEIDLSNSEKAVRTLKVLLTSDADWKYRFFDEGDLGARTPSVYVTGLWGEHGDDFEIEFATALTQVGDDLVRLHYMRYGSPDITGEAKPILRDVIDSIHIP